MGSVQEQHHDTTSQEVGNHEKMQEEDNTFLQKSCDASVRTADGVSGGTVNNCNVSGVHKGDIYDVHIGKLVYMDNTDCKTAPQQSYSSKATSNGVERRAILCEEDVTNSDDDLNRHRDEHSLIKQVHNAVTDKNGPVMRCRKRLRCSESIESSFGSSQESQSGDRQATSAHADYHAPSKINTPTEDKDLHIPLTTGQSPTTCPSVRNRTTSVNLYTADVELSSISDSHEINLKAKRRTFRGAQTESTGNSFMENGVNCLLDTNIAKMEEIAKCNPQKLKEISSYLDNILIPSCKVDNKVNSNTMRYCCMLSGGLVFIAAIGEICHYYITLAK